MYSRSARVVLLLAAVGLACALAAGLLGALGATPAARAQMDPAAREGLGSIAGAVADKTGAPLAGIQVDLFAYVYLPGGEQGWKSVRTARTAADGRYAAALTPGVYRVRFSDPGGVYALQYYSHSLTLESAQDVVIAGNAVVGIDGRLQAAGTIGGALHLEHLPFLYTGKVGAYTLAGGTWQVAQTSDITGDSTGGVAYLLAGLPAATYRVCLTEPVDGYQRVQPCYDRIAGGVGYATDIAVQAGERVTGIDLWDQGFTDLATLAGRVTDAEGAGLPDIGVTIFSTEGDYYSFYTSTNAAGDYAFQVVAPAVVALQFSNQEGLYVSRSYSGTVALQRAEVRSGLDISLTLGGRITGVWTFDGSNAGLVAIDVQDPLRQYAAAETYTAMYRIGGLPAGVYRVCDLRWQIIAPGYGYSCYPDGAPYTAAANITVTTGSTVADINYVKTVPPPTEGAAVTGAVRGPDGQPLAGIDVALLLFTLSAAANDPATAAAGGATFPAHTETAADGTFRFEGVVDGLYAARAYDPAGVYATTYYPNRPPWSAGEWVEVVNDQSPDPLAIQMPLGGALSGWVQGAGGQLVPRTYVTLIETGDGGQLIEYWPVDRNGRFAITGLWPAIYRVCATTDVWPFTGTRCYGSVPGKLQTEVYQPVTVTAGMTVTGVGITLGPMPENSVFLPAVEH